MTGRKIGRTHDGTKGKAALAEISLLLAAFFVGTDFVSVKYALRGLPPLALVPLRYIVAGLLLLGLLRLLGRKSGLVPRDLPAMAGLGLVGVALNQIGYTVGLSLTSGSHGALIFATAPVWGLLLGIVLGLERGTWRGAMGLGFAVVGVTLVVGDGLGSPEASVGGDLLVYLSALSWGAYTILSLPVLGRFDPLFVAGWTMLLGALRRSRWPLPASPPSRSRSAPWSGLRSASGPGSQPSTRPCSQAPSQSQRGRPTSPDWARTGCSCTCTW
jgi:drug/metabolite transporter (DMT)-like permease